MSLLDDSQQFTLQAERYFTNPIEEQHAAIGKPKSTHPVFWNMILPQPVSDGCS